MTQVATVSHDVAQARVTIAGVRKMLSEATEPDVVTEARNRIKLAREWAKIQKVAAEVSRDLLAIEAECLRRICQLGALDVLKPHERRAAEFFGAMSDAELAAVVEEFGNASTAVGVFRASERATQDRFKRDRGRRIGQGREYDEPDENFDASVKYYNVRVRAALASIVDEYAAHDSFTVGQMADDLLTDIGWDPLDVDPAVRDGISEVCRAAVRKAPPSVVDGFTTPRFVTCYEPESGSFIRIPFNNARIEQLEQMLTIRREQLEQDRAALTRLESIHRQLVSARSLSAIDSDRIGDIVDGSWLGGSFEMPRDVHFRGDAA